MSSQRACKTLAARQCASHLFLQNLHPAIKRKPDANFIWLVTSRRQTIDKFGYFVLDSRKPDAICIRLAAD
jgi:hypothetical protein